MKMIRFGLLAAAAVAVSLSVGACTTLNEIKKVDTTNVANQATDIIEQIRTATFHACGFLPTIQTVQSILGNFVPGAVPVLAVVSTVESGICSAVTKKSARRGGPAPKFAGVTIEGEFVK